MLRNGRIDLCHLPIDTLDNPGGCVRVMVTVRQCVDISRKTGRGRRIDTRDVMVDAGLQSTPFSLLVSCLEIVAIANLLARIAHCLLHEMDQIRRTQLSQRRKLFCPGVDRLVEDVLG